MRPPRRIDEHLLESVDRASQLNVEALDQPDIWGVNSEYRIEWLAKGTPRTYYTGRHGFAHVDIHFHNPALMIVSDGPGVNGVTNEALLAVLIDRLNARADIKDGYANAHRTALGYCRAALHALKFEAQHELLAQHATGG